MRARPRILVCDESPSYARALTAFLEAGDVLEVVGVCATGREAVEAVPRLAPDLVMFDLLLADGDGLREVEQIVRSHAVPVLVLSERARRDSPEAAEALAAGALEALPKSHLHLDAPEGAAAMALRYRLQRLARGHGLGGAVGTAERRPAVVGICASAGGPRALETVLAGLPADFPLPVLVVQHISAGFTKGLVRWLDGRVPLPVRLARAGEPMQPGVCFAPEDAHLRLDRTMRVVLDRETVSGRHRPSADLLLVSLATVVGAGAIAVVLTGMGRDGEVGADAVRRAGGQVIAQDEPTSVIFGMPKAAADAGGALVLPLPEIAAALGRIGTAVTGA